MVLGYHLVFSAYGFWLPNDPRGSGSSFVRSEALREFGPATKVRTHRSVASKPHDVNLRLAAKEALQYPPVHFSDEQCQAIGRGFGEYVKKSGVIVWACAILPEHVHLVIARHRYKVEQIANLIKGAGTSALFFEGSPSVSGIPRRERKGAALLGRRGVQGVFEHGGGDSSAYSLCGGESAKGGKAAAGMGVCDAL